MTACQREITLAPLLLQLSGTYIIVSGKPDYAGNNNAQKVGTEVGNHGRGATRRNLFLQTKDPSGRKGFKETNQQHDLRK